MNQFHSFVTELKNNHEKIVQFILNPSVQKDEYRIESKFQKKIDFLHSTMQSIIEETFMDNTNSGDSRFRQRMIERLNNRKKHQKSRNQGLGKTILSSRNAIYSFNCDDSLCIYSEYCYNWGDICGDETSCTDTIGTPNHCSDSSTECGHMNSACNDFKIDVCVDGNNHCIDNMSCRDAVHCGNTGSIPANACLDYTNCSDQACTNTMCFDKGLCKDASTCINLSDCQDGGATKGGCRDITCQNGTIGEQSAGACGDLATCKDVVCKDQGEKCYDSNGCKDDKCKNYAEGIGSGGCVDSICKDIQECSDFNLCTDESSCEDSNECTDVTKCTDVSTCLNHKCVNSADCTHSANCTDFDCQYDAICTHNPGQCTHFECEPEGN